MEHKLGKFCTVSTMSGISTMPDIPSGSSDIVKETHVDEMKEDHEFSPQAIPSQVYAESDDSKEAEDESMLVETDVSDTPSLPHENSQKHRYEYGYEHHIPIRQESIKYMGYYSTHEQQMQRLILKQAAKARKKIYDMVTKGMVHCFTHILWNKLQCTSSKKDKFTKKAVKSKGLSYSEFLELRSLANVDLLSHLDSRLEALLYQPLSWYHNLAKVLMNKYAGHHRVFTSPDGTEQHIVVLHPRYLEAFVMLSIDTQTSRGDLRLVCRKINDEDHWSNHLDICLSDMQTLIENFVNTCCFHLWTSVI